MPLLIAGLLLVCLAGDDSRASVRTFETGRLIENVPSASAEKQRFTLYLPTGFDPQRPTPILYLMDPRGRARVPARLFQEAAERYGYILVSSGNMASDGPMEPNLHALHAMLDDMEQWFTIDPARTYLVGFSGTARMASLLAQHKSETFAGFIGVGAGFHPDVRPSPTTPFLYFGAVGDVDYNFHEVQTLEHSLAALDLPYRLETFPGAHSWLTPALATRAVEWLELRAMQAGSRPIDAALVEAWWERDDAVAHERMLERRQLDAARQYAAMARDFAGLRDTDAIKRAAERIASAPAAEAELRRRLADTRRSDFWVQDAMQAIADAFPTGGVEPAIPVEELARELELAEMKRKAAGRDREAALEAQRRLHQLDVQLGFYLPHEALSRAETARAHYYLSLAVQVDDTSPVTWYMKAQTHARLDAPRQALAALGRAIDAGFRDLSLLEADASFRKLRGGPGYAAIIERLRAEGDGLDRSTVDRPPVFVLPVLNR
jgi:dienelactone hydrolase